ncbi:MAG: hypothetical protein ABSC45_08585 [Desulfobaccales bacterium]|jgi:hypothetical protein
MVEDSIKDCPICKLEDKSIEETSSHGPAKSLSIKCPRCKNFILAFEALIAIGGIKQPIPKLSAWIRDVNEKGADTPVIYAESFERIPASIPDYSPREKQIKLLQNIERNTKYPGDLVTLNNKYDFPLAWASSENEFVYYITSLEERGFIKVRNRSAPGNYPVTITSAGWDYREQQDKNIEERTQAFVAMSFHKDLEPIWRGPISNAIRKAGYKPHRVDAEPHNELIDMKIISGIKDSRFVVADFTRQNNGVYFEAGYAQGFGLNVIRCVREDDFEKLHFDKNHYNFIRWKTPEDLEDQLYNFICAIIGKGKGN